MKIPKEIYKYIEYELFHYDIYKEELLLEKERILESGYGIGINERVSGGQRYDKTGIKASDLVESAAVLSLERTIRSIENAIVTEEHGALFREYYQKKRKDFYDMLNDLGMTRSTFYRYRTDIVINTAREMGILKPGYSWKA